MLEIAKVLKPQGLKGEIKIECYLKDEESWKELKKVKISNEVYNILSVRFYKSFGFLKLDKINSIEEAETLRNKKVFVYRENVETKSDEYLISDLEGCKVVDENENLVGFVESVEQYGSADIINILIGGERKSFPFLKALTKEVDVENKKIVVFKNKLDEVLI